MDNKKIKLSGELEKINLNLNDYQIDQLLMYYQLLVEKNKEMNLTAITDFSEVVIKHFVDSLTCIKVVNFSEVHQVIDVGTGAGFPGIPLKIVFPHIKITLLDSLNKRVGFLNEVISSLQLENSKAVHTRAEDAGHLKEYREAYDLCVSRAVANYGVLLEYCLPFVKTGGKFVSYKSVKAEEEISSAAPALTVLGAKIVKIETFVLSGTDQIRNLITAEKIRSTPERYPRKAGIPEKKPIK